MVEREKGDKVFPDDKKKAQLGKSDLLIYQIIVYVFLFLEAIGYIFSGSTSTKLLPITYDPFLLAIFSILVGCLFIISLFGLILKQRFAYYLAWFLTFLQLIDALIIQNTLRDMFYVTTFNLAIMLCLSRIKGPIKPQTKSDEKALILIALILIGFLCYTLITVVIT